MTDRGRVAIIAGQGGLAAAVAARLDEPLVAALDGHAPDLPHQVFRLERLVPFLDQLTDKGVATVTFAGAVRRPALEPELFDARTATLVPRIVAAMGSGDDAALREVIAIFEEWGFAVAGTAEIAPDLVPGPELITGTPSARDLADLDRAADILAATGPLDLGQGAVVAGGLCLALETLPGTQAMLDFTARHAALKPAGASGVFYKAPKPDQDRRIDLPTIGPETVAQAARAGLAGIAWQASATILLERERCVACAEEAGLFLWSRPAATDAPSAAPAR